MIDGSVLQSAQRCFEKKSRVVMKMVVMKSPRRVLMCGNPDNITETVNRLSLVYPHQFPVI